MIALLLCLAVAVVGALGFLRRNSGARTAYTSGSRGGGSGSLGVPTFSASVNQGAQGVPATRTAAGAEGSFTTTTITLPLSAKPTTIYVTISTASALVQVPTAGKRFSAGMVMAANPPLVLDVSGLPETTSVDIQTQATAAAVIGMTANYAGA